MASIPRGSLWLGFPRKLKISSRGKVKLIGWDSSRCCVKVGQLGAIRLTAPNWIRLTSHPSRKVATILPACTLDESNGSDLVHQSCAAGQRLCVHAVTNKLLGPYHKT